VIEHVIEFPWLVDKVPREENKAIELNFDQKINVNY
jgi:hypothetical protein